MRNELRDNDYTQLIAIDALIHPAQIEIVTAEEFENLEPCGIGNPEAILGCRNVECTGAKVIGSDKTHLSFSIRREAYFNIVCVVCIISAFLNNV